MDLNDLYDIIDNYSDAAFERCKSLLYKPLFSVTPESEIRRVDFKEQLTSFFKLKKYPQKHFERDFVKYTEGIVEKYIVFESERDKKYDSERKSLVQALLKDDVPLEFLEDYFFIYLSQCFQFSDKKAFNGSYRTKDVNYYINKTDLLTIANIFNKADYYYIYKTVKRPIIQDKEEKQLRAFRDDEKMFVYIISVIMYYHILQFGGEI